ncbi:hypothetical protein SteCoe_32472 [Stentor coeruleus]|uniref:Uncharacterized protein n=1 Tax=Stentor coeruleus TaxID=5963 RepID=A0A1R2AZC6_9CILI|nr:hypothetical protein SteCoe_32472 [Stentor coeruleus]
MSHKYKSSGDLSDSLSQGEAYLSLLNDSLTEKWQTNEISDHKSYIAKTYAKDTLNYLEDDVNHLGQEVLELRSQNCYLEAQVHVLEKEKEMHIASHAKEKLKLEALIKEHSLKVHNETKEMAKQLEFYKNRTQELEDVLQEEREKRLELAKRLKVKLENREKELMIVIKEKDKYIHQLQIQLEQGKCSRVCSYNPIQAVQKRKTSKKIVKIPTFKSYSVNIPNKSESSLESISNMIVKLEKEQADINLTMSEFDYSSPRDKSKRQLQEIMTRNEEKLKEAKSIQQSLLREKFSSTFT